MNIHSGALLESHQRRGITYMGQDHRGLVIPSIRNM